MNCACDHILCTMLVPRVHVLQQTCHKRHKILLLLLLSGEHGSGKGCQLRQALHHVVEVVFDTLQSGQKPEEQGEKAWIQEGGCIRPRWSQDDVDGVVGGAEETLLLAEVPVQDL